MIKKYFFILFIVSAFVAGVYFWKQEIACNSFLSCLELPSLLKNNHDVMPASPLVVVSEDRLYEAIEGDINADGQADRIEVVGKDGGPQEDYSSDRLMVLFIQESDGSYEEVARNGEVILCSQCGGMMGDPYTGVTVTEDGFIIHHYGGSAWRWMHNLRFSYDREADDWSLAEVTGGSYHTSNPDTEESAFALTPRDFGEIHFSDFREEVVSQLLSGE